MSEQSNTSKYYYPTDLIFATTVGIGIVCLLAKYRGSIVQRLKKVKAITDPLGNQNTVIINSPIECENIVQKLKKRCEDFRVLGFDCEWVTVDGTRHKIALVQLAARDGLCALIRICQLKHIPLELKDLLEDASILKVGVAPGDDAKYLLNDYGVCVRGCLDLRHLVVQNDGKATGGLAGLSQSILGVKLDKSWKIRCSNWEKDCLTDQQINYAARDALVGMEIFKVLIGGRLKWHWMPWNKYQAKSTDMNSKINELCRYYLDVKFKNKPIEGSSPKNGKVSSEAMLKNPRPLLNKPKTRSYVTRRTTMYHNCYMQAPDGELLCTCDRKKAEWYVLKNLATKLSEDPLTIRLNFEPAGRVVDEAGLFYTQAKENCCVVCGQTDSYLRKNIVPHSYRKYFPKVMKDHTSHDVLLVCLDCHLLSNFHDSIMRNKLAVDCEAPIAMHPKYFLDVEAKQAQMSAKALLSNAHRIPEERKKKLEDNVLAFYKDRSEVTKELLREALTLETSTLNNAYQSHGQKVVEHFSTQRSGGLTELERLWREHFLETMKPRFLPKLWSVTHNRSRLAQRAEENRVLSQDLAVAGLGDYAHLVTDNEQRTFSPDRELNSETSTESLLNTSNPESIDNGSKETVLSNAMQPDISDRECGNGLSVHSEVSLS